MEEDKGEKEEENPIGCTWPISLLSWELTPPATCIPKHAPVEKRGYEAGQLIKYVAVRARGRVHAIKLKDAIVAARKGRLQRLTVHGHNHGGIVAAKLVAAKNRANAALDANVALQFHL